MNGLVQDILHLEGPLYRAETITLPYEHNTFSVSFVALSYEDPLKNRYSYRLKGVDKEWVINSEQNTASYTNLPPGKYEFEVRGSNNDHKWNDQTTSLLIGSHASMVADYMGILCLYTSPPRSCLLCRLALEPACEEEIQTSYGRVPDYERKRGLQVEDQFLY